MFGNLKSRLGDVADLKKYASPQVLSSLTGSRQRSSQHTPGAQTPNLLQHSRQPSDASLSGVGNTSVSYSTLLEQNENELCSTDEIKGINTDKIEDLEKLKITLESQKDAALQRLNAKEQEWGNKLEQEQKKIASLEEELKNAQIREEVLSKKLGEKESENSVSTESLAEKEAKLKDVEQKLIDLQEDYDQLEGLSTQEVAKVKHLLLNTTSDLESAKLKMEEKSKEVEVLTKRVATFEGIEERIHTISEEKMDLETQVAGLKQKLNVANSRHQTESEQQEEEIKHLKEKITLLDRRQSQETMEEDERNQAILKEREGYEHKLEETRQQLNNIKSSWSEKITALEAQIQNLNKKIAEDQADFRACEASNESLRKQVEELKDIKKGEEEKHGSEVKALQQDFERLEEDVETSKWQLETETNKKNQEIKDLRRNLHVQEEKSKQLAEELASKKEENLKMNESYSELKLEMQDLKGKALLLGSKYVSLQSSNATLQESLNRERAGAEAIGKELETVKERYEVACTEKSKLSSNLDKYLDKVNEYDSTVKALEDEKLTFVQRIRALEGELEEARSRNEELEKNVFELETDFDSKVETSCLVQELREKLKNSEDEVSEKKQMLKVQAQRLADMKKTIQRELKINPDSTDALGDSGGVSQLSPRLSSDHQKAVTNPNKSFLFKVKQKANESQNGDLESDPVNLEYLKHVILKFITSREYEAVQLTRAVSTLLHMSPEEESLLRETLEWKMSWFGSRPNIGKGQLAKAIPPSQ